MRAGERKMLKNFFQSIWKTESAKSICELYTNDNKLNNSSNLKEIYKSAKNIIGKTLHQEDTFQSCYY